MRHKRNARRRKTSEGIPVVVAWQRGSLSVEQFELYAKSLTF